jgi:hypothetical protein
MTEATHMKVSDVTMIALPCDDSNAVSTFEAQRGYKWHYYTTSGRGGIRIQCEDNYTTLTKMLRVTNGGASLGTAFPHHEDLANPRTVKQFIDHDLCGNIIPTIAQFSAQTSAAYMLTDIAVMLRRSLMDDKMKDILISFIAMSNLFDQIDSSYIPRSSVVKTPLDFITVAKTPYPEDLTGTAERIFAEATDESYVLKQP